MLYFLFVFWELEIFKTCRKRYQCTAEKKLIHLKKELFVWIETEGVTLINKTLKFILISLKI